MNERTRFSYQVAGLEFRLSWNFDQGSIQTDEIFLVVLADLCVVRRLGRAPSTWNPALTHSRMDAESISLSGLVEETQVGVQRAVPLRSVTEAGEVLGNEGDGRRPNDPCAAPRS